MKPFLQSSLWILSFTIAMIISSDTSPPAGTTLIIVVGVALDIVKALESQLLMRHYKGFLSE